MTTVPEPAGPGEPSRWQTVVKTARVFRADFRERAVSTFWQTFVATMAMAQPTTNWSELERIFASSMAAGLAAVLSMAKSTIVRNRGIKNSASSSKNV
jgi:hypothetical protein